MRFAPEYVAYVLNQNFEDAKELFAGPLIAIHYAHLVMLAAQGVISGEDARAIRVALDALATTDLSQVKYDGTYEDLFFYMERLISSIGIARRSSPSTRIRSEPSRPRWRTICWRSSSSSNATACD
jgi:argininosuccinate lyase